MARRLIHTQVYALAQSSQSIKNYYNLKYKFINKKTLLKQIALKSNCFNRLTIFVFSFIHFKLLTSLFWSVDNLSDFGWVAYILI